MTTTYGQWVYLYPCTECDNLLGPNAFDTGAIYRPCFQCGGRIGNSIPGRAVYKEEIVQKSKWFGLLKYEVKTKQFVKWEKR